MSAHIRLRRFGLLAALALAGAAHAQGVLTVEVFANSAMHITPRPDQRLPYQLKVYRMDGLQQLEASLNQQLPKNEGDHERGCRPTRAGSSAR